MSKLYQASLVTALLILLAACGNTDDHGHAHDGDADHAHDAASAEHGHAHDGDDHAHPHGEGEHDTVQTEAFFGDDAGTPAEPGDAAADDEEEDEEELHRHDGKPHAHKH